MFGLLAGYFRCRLIAQSIVASSFANATYRAQSATSTQKRQPDLLEQAASALNRLRDQRLSKPEHQDGGPPRQPLPSSAGTNGGAPVRLDAATRSSSSARDAAAPQVASGAGTGVRVSRKHQPAHRPIKPNTKELIPALLGTLNAFVTAGHHRDDLFRVIAACLVNAGVQQLSITETIQVAEGFAKMQVYDRRLFEDIVLHASRWPGALRPSHACRLLVALAAVRHRDAAGGRSSSSATLLQLLEAAHRTALAAPRLQQLAVGDLAALHKALQLELRAAPHGMVLAVKAALAGKLREQEDEAAAAAELAATAKQEEATAAASQSERQGEEEQQQEAALANMERAEERSEEAPDRWERQEELAAMLPDEQRLEEGEKDEVMFSKQRQDGKEVQAAASVDQSRTEEREG